jgi:hypothetical protein
MTFSPQRLTITNITQADPAVVTTDPNHNLTTGQVVRVHVPVNYGMFQLNNLLASITVLSPDTFSLQYSQVPVEVNVNSTNYPAFISPSNPGFTAEIIPVGAGPTPITAIPWQIQNNLCVSLVEDATRNNSTTEIPF